MSDMPEIIGRLADQYLPEASADYNQLILASIHMRAAEGHITELEKALKLIAGDGCERLFGSDCRKVTGWSRTAKYSADRWCDPCIAAAALEPAKSARQQAPDAEMLVSGAGLDTGLPR